MTTKREQVLSALFTILGSASNGVAVLRNDVLPERVPERGLMILRDGDPGEPEVTLSPLTWHWEHRAEIEVFVRGKDGREAAFDTLAAAIGRAIAANRTLGGNCDWVEAAAPAPTDLPVDGGTPIKAALITVVLHYSSRDTLG